VDENGNTVGNYRIVTDSDENKYLFIKLNDASLYAKYAVVKIEKNSAGVGRVLIGTAENAVATTIFFDQNVLNAIKNSIQWAKGPIFLMEPYTSLSNVESVLDKYFNQPSRKIWVVGFSPNADISSGEPDINRNDLAADYDSTHYELKLVNYNNTPEGYDPSQPVDGYGFYLGEYGGLGPVFAIGGKLNYANQPPSEH
jgi:hypothetical protein